MSSAPVEVQAGVGIHRAQALYASVIRSCARCGAPGYWHNTPGVNVGCYAPDKVTQLGSDPVGMTCPNCGAARPSAVEDQGLIWHKFFGTSIARLLAEVRLKLRRLFHERRV